VREWFAERDNVNDDRQLQVDWANRVNSVFPGKPLLCLRFY
jgi:hypothetical protein